MARELSTDPYVPLTGSLPSRATQMIDGERRDMALYAAIRQTGDR
ncbi:hypothetical protein [Brevibacterium renqingii]|nr:hypothetical protein [Brevibacterium renqingii]